MTLSAVDAVPNSKSPFAVVVTFPLLTAVLTFVAEEVTSREFDVATPEYSEIAKRKGPETLMETVTVFAPALMFSA